MRRKIVIVTRSTPLHRLGGMEVVLWDLAKEFARLGQDITVLTTSIGRTDASTSISGVKLACLPCSSGKYSIKWWILSRRFFRENLAKDTDVVLSVSAGAFALSRRGSKAAFVAQLHGTAWGEFLSKLRQRRLVPWLTSIRNLGWLLRDFRYRMFDVLTFVGPAVFEEASRAPMSTVFGDYVPKRIITNGVSEEQFAFDGAQRLRIRRGLGYGDNDKVVVWSSRLHYQKGVLEGLRAFQIAAQTDGKLKMLIVGDGPEKTSLERFVADNNLSARVTMTGRIPREDLPGYLSAADLFLFTTKRVEGLPMNVLEALANGLPAIVSNSINHPDFGAIGVEPDDSANVARCIFANGPRECRTSALKEQYTLEFSANEYLRLFSNISAGAM
ncbi:glycosyltransferase involved in cell wall biosynthesis [Rhizobium azibense]|uniref:Glycosyltransferase involved in cell wall biosynthesis n=2 Tax=Rhizobium azibense TaxID=1136135 RepID=A0A4R3QYF2_9HYPH|nr:glycosyltransferase involved in cell wall biosynthesis [Rhizobium azibense]